MKKIKILLILFAVSFYGYGQTTIWSENFDATDSLMAPTGIGLNSIPATWGQSTVPIVNDIFPGDSVWNIPDPNGLDANPLTIDELRCQGSTKLGSNILVTNPIPVYRPLQGAKYELTFDWQSEFSKNCGANVNPSVGDGNVDYADITIRISTSEKLTPSTFVDKGLLFDEDNQSIIENNTFTNIARTIANVWPYSDATTYYATFDISSYITATTANVKLTFTYTDKGRYPASPAAVTDMGGQFVIDNLVITEEANPKFVMKAAEPFSASASFLMNYSYIPVTQLSNPYVNLGAVITNNGIATFANADLTATLDDNVSAPIVYGVKTITPALLPAGTTQYITMAAPFASDYPNGVSFSVANSPYTLTYNATINGELQPVAPGYKTVSFSVHDTKFQKYISSAGTLNVSADDISGGIGTLFQFFKKDVIDQVTVDLNTSAATTHKFNMSVYKVSGPNATKGTLVQTSANKEFNGSPNTYTFGGDIPVEAGYYIFMFNQMDVTPLEVEYDATAPLGDFGIIYRGDADTIYKEPTIKGELKVSIDMVLNTAPVITKNFPLDPPVTGTPTRVWVANKLDSVKISATDVNLDSLFWTLESKTPVWLTDWIKIKDNKDGSCTIYGTPKSVNLGVSSIDLSVTDKKSASVHYNFNFSVVGQLSAGLPLPDQSAVDQDFGGPDGDIPNNWLELVDKQNSGNLVNWGIFNEAGPGKIMTIDGNGDATKLQDEWLISNPISLPVGTSALATTYTLSFKWAVGDFNYFCKGIPGVLGSSLGANDKNLADVTVMISKDNGLTWSAPIWKEDDKNLLASSTEGIYPGVKWGYSNYSAPISTSGYTSKFDLKSYIGDTILVAFRYQGVGAVGTSNAFYIDDFRVLMNKTVDISAVTSVDYESLAMSQTGEITVTSTIINMGRTVPAGASFKQSLPEMGFEKTVTLNNAFFATGNTQTLVYKFKPVANVAKTYNFTTSITAANNAPTYGTGGNLKSITIGATDLYIDNDASYKEWSNGYFDGLGTVYNITKGDHLKTITVDFGAGIAASTPVSVSIIKIDSATATTGNLIATINDNAGAVINASTTGAAQVFTLALDKDISADLYLVPGMYLVLVNPTDATNKQIYIDRSNNLYDKNNVVRGNISKLYKDTYDRGSLNMSLNFAANTKPKFVDNAVPPGTITTYLAEVLEGKAASFNFLGKDADKYDVIGFVQDTVPAFLKQPWLSFSFAKKDTAVMTVANTVKAGDYPARLKVFDGLDTVALDITIKVVGKLQLKDNISETFPSLTIPADKNTAKGDNTWMYVKGLKNDKTAAEWSVNAGLGLTLDVSATTKYVDQTLVSPYLYFKAPSLDTTYLLSFIWRVENPAIMIGGTKGVIGSSKAPAPAEVGTNNNADLRVKVSNDGGTTWVVLWQEDDEALVRAADTAGIGYPYTAAAQRTARINVTSYAGKELLFAIQYEGMGGSQVYVDDFKLVRTKPYVNLVITNANVIPVRMPIKQAQHVNIKYSVKNMGTTVSKTSTVSAVITKNGNALNPEYNNSVAMTAIPANSSTEFTFPMLNTNPGETGNTYQFDFKISEPYGAVTKNYPAVIGDEEYGYVAPGDPDGLLTSVMNKGLGQIFEIFEADMLTRIVSYSSTTPAAAAAFSRVFSIVKLTSATATSGTEIYNSGVVTTAANSPYFDVEDVMLEKGIYALFIETPVAGATFDAGYGDNASYGKFIIGDATTFSTVTSGKYLALRMVFDNSNPFFATAAGGVLDFATLKEVAEVGVKYSKTFRVKDNDLDDVANVMGLDLPSWLAVVDTNDNGVITLEGTPTVIDTCKVTLRAYDGTVNVDKSFTIIVNPKAVPKFVTTPSANAYEGVAYSYTAIATHKSAVTLTSVSDTTWLKVKSLGDTLIFTGTPKAANLGALLVKITATANGETSQQVFSIQVLGNKAPVFVSSGVSAASANIKYAYNVVASDDNGNAGLIIAATKKPSWLTLTDLGSGKATLDGTPTAASVDTVILTVTDVALTSATQQFIVTVVANGAPVVPAVPASAKVATEDVLYVYNIVATDPDGNSMYFVTNKIPSWLTLTVTGNGKAKLQGIPTQSNMDETMVSLVVGDGNNKTAIDYTIVVTAVNDAPAIISNAVETALVGEVYSYTVEAIDEEGASLMYAAKIPAWLSISESNGIATISGVPTEENVGDAEIAVTVNDGNSSTEQVFILSVGGATSVNNDALSAVAVYPNPTSGSFSVRNAEGADVYVINSTGQIVKQISKASKVQEINISELNAGTYFVRIVNEDKVLTKSLNLIK